VHSDHLARLRQALGLDALPPELFEQALRHMSYVRERGQDELASNQRLEFLGDAVLDLVFADYLYRTRPELTEGQLTRLKAELVRKSALAAVARELNLGEHLLLGRGEESTGGREKDSLLADAVEALIGAVFVAGGWAAVCEFVMKHFDELLCETRRRRSLRDAKSRLQELLQALGAPPPLYEVVHTEGPPHDRLFHVHAVYDGRVIGVGTGSAKRDAEQEAAARALATREDWLEE